MKKNYPLTASGEADGQRDVYNLYRNNYTIFNWSLLRDTILNSSLREDLNLQEFSDQLITVPELYMEKPATFTWGDLLIPKRELVLN